MNHTLLYLGSITSDQALQSILLHIEQLKKTYQPHCIMANVSSINNGHGLLSSQWQILKRANIDILISSHRLWSSPDAQYLLKQDAHLLSPANYGYPGISSLGYCSMMLEDTPIAILSLQGQVGFQTPENPFIYFQRLYPSLQKMAKTIIIDFHGTSYQEKQAFSLFVDGKATAVIGSYSRVPTADEKILPGGTAHICDTGYCGAEPSCLGDDSEVLYQRSVSYTPLPIVPQQGPVILQGVILNWDIVHGKAHSIKRFTYQT